MSSPIQRISSDEKEEQEAEKAKIEEYAEQLQTLLIEIKARKDDSTVW
jgi:hypothetical protein